MDQPPTDISTDRLFDDGPVVAFRWDNKPGWPVVAVSPSVRQFGYTAEDFLSNRIPYPRFVHPDDLERVGREVREHEQAGRRRFEQSYRVICADGQVRLVLDSTAAEVNAAGVVTHYHGYLLDRTELEEARAESELRSTQLLLALEGTGTGLWDLRLPGGEVILDRTGQELASLDPQQPVTQIDQWLELIHPDDRPRVEENLNEHLAGSAPMLRQELRLARPDGTWRWLLLKGRVVERDIDQGALRLLGTIHDIHGERARLEDETHLREQSLRRQKMASLEQVSGGVAHRFNNLLAAILGNVELLLLEPGLPPALRSGLEDVQGQAAVAADLSLALLSYTGNRLLMPEELESGVWLREQAARLAQELGCELRLDLEGGLPALWMDAEQVSQALRQVLLNAIEAGSPPPLDLCAGLRVKPDPCRKPVAGQLPDGEGPFLLVRVSDRGPGMTEAQLERIFDPFFTTRFVGRGLGMATVRGVLLAHRGGIQVHSRPGEGTVVNLYLPLAGTPQDEGNWQDLLSAEGVPQDGR